MCHLLWQVVSLSFILLFPFHRWRNGQLGKLSDCGGMGAEYSIWPPSLPLFTLSLGRKIPTRTFRVAFPHSSVYCHMLCVSFCAVTHYFGKGLHPSLALNQGVQVRLRAKILQSWLPSQLWSKAQRLQGCRVPAGTVERGCMCSQEIWFLLLDHRPIRCVIWDKLLCLSGVRFFLWEISRRWACGVGGAPSSKYSRIPWWCHWAFKATSRGWGVSWNSRAPSSPEPKAMLSVHIFKNNYDKCQAVDRRV